MNKPRGRPFEPGNTAGRGRPKGSRNAPKPPGQELLDEFAPHITRKCISIALQGDRVALRLCMERISPARQDACIQMNLPRIKKAEDLEKAAEKVTQNVGRGKITPIEGEKVMNILQIRSRLIETGQLENRVEKLEEERVVPPALPWAA
jgi:predicted DNA-binding protein (UPF0251 family)